MQLLVEPEPQRLTGLQSRRLMGLQLRRLKRLYLRWLTDLSHGGSWNFVHSDSQDLSRGSSRGFSRGDPQDILFKGLESGEPGVFAALAISQKKNHTLCLLLHAEETSSTFIFSTTLKFQGLNLAIKFYAACFCEVSSSGVYGVRNSLISQSLL